MLKEHGWSPRRCIPHGGHQMSLNIAAGLGLGGNESYPDVFQPFGGFADDTPVVDGYVTLPDVPGHRHRGQAAPARRPARDPPMSRPIAADHHDDQHTHGPVRRQWIGWGLGVLALVLTVVLPPPEGLSPEGWRTAGAGMLMAIFWITEPIPIPVTALLPLVLFPALGLGDIRATSAPYANPIIYLFLGGFIIALAMERWQLHRRIAIGLVSRLGTKPKAIIAGFLLSSGLVSMWVSNTATTLMMLPIAMSVAHLVPNTGTLSRELSDFRTALLLSIAYGATSGGMATLIGTPPNALLAAYMSEVYQVTIGFGQWMLLGVPVSLVAMRDRLRRADAGDVQARHAAAARAGRVDCRGARSTRAGQPGRVRGGRRVRADGRGLGDAAADRDGHPARVRHDHRHRRRAAAVHDSGEPEARRIRDDVGGDQGPAVGRAAALRRRPEPGRQHRDPWARDAGSGASPAS